ncbi:single-stranded-DNA-specific exonuclease RecJ [Moraxella nasovis]|uniref:single-stranded-DNA-specific exonuclease RecJ n=1 Tax=Moraxella nasovis TaxID=2904121 RepID=UPI001F61254D|nr:single-stranded-DNA-specific exonuclease RecJ [Moraxella nasovis]UNU72988.1 single-stranded-DNA-specific exonuclease RecJ [Moraxella nasovis]
MTIKTTSLNLTQRYTGKVPDELTKQLGSQTLALVMMARGIDDTRLLDVSVGSLLPATDLLGIDEAARLIDQAIDAGERILVVGDFDCDGATSTALVVRCLRQMGATVEFIVPDRFKFGYGLTPEIVTYSADKFNPDLIITVDNGISSHDGVQQATNLGIKVIITDHHLTTKPSPKAAAVVNPNQQGCQFGSKSLVGVGVAFYVMGRVAKLRREANKTTTNVSRYLDLVALGTIADVGVLDQNNRILVTHGLNAIRAGRACLGVLAILEQASRDYQKITSDDFGFAIAPRINAAGRMDNMRTGVECLLADDWGAAHTLALELNRLNQSRRSVEMQMRDEANSIIETLHLTDECGETKELPKSVVLYQDSWHQGVIGIVAGRIKERLYRPCIVFAPADAKCVGDDDLIKGSARSIAGIHVRDAIEAVAVANPELILHFGGHAMAAGLTIYKRHFTAFAKAFNQVMNSFDDKVFSEEQFTDGTLLPEDFSLQFATDLKNISVWGNGFVLPSFDGVFHIVDAKVLKDKHLKLTLKHDGVMYPIDAIWFNYDADRWDYRASLVHILYTLDINEWKGVQNIQLIIKDLAVVETTL